MNNLVQSHRTKENITKIHELIHQGKGIKVTDKTVSNENWKSRRQPDMWKAKDRCDNGGKKPVNGYGNNTQHTMGYGVVYYATEQKVSRGLYTCLGH